MFSAPLAGAAGVLSDALHETSAMPMPAPRTMARNFFPIGPPRSLFLHLLDRGDDGLDGRRLRVVGGKGDELAEVLQGLGVIALVEIDEAELVVRLGPVLLDL